MISPARRRIVYNAIRAAILKGQEVEYWALRMYDQLEAGVLTDEQVAELEVLIDEYYNPPTPEPTPEPEPEPELTPEEPVEGSTGAEGAAEGEGAE